MSNKILSALSVAALAACSPLKGAINIPGNQWAATVTSAQPQRVPSGPPSDPYYVNYLKKAAAEIIKQNFAEDSMAIVIEGGFILHNPFQFASCDNFRVHKSSAGYVGKVVFCGRNADMKNALLRRLVY